MKKRILMIAGLFVSCSVFGQLADPSAKANYERAKAAVANAKAKKVRDEV